MSHASPTVTLPRESTPTLLRYLRACVESAPNKTDAVVLLLRCSKRTAERLLSNNTVYSKRMKLVWASIICASAGVSLEVILGTRVSKSCQQALVGWIRARSISEALQLASDCAQSICIMALNAYKLTGFFTLRYANTGPLEVSIHLSPAPELAVYGNHLAPHQLIVNSDTGTDGRRRMFIRHYHPTVGHVSKLPLDLKTLENLIRDIYVTTKNYTADLKRETRELSASRATNGGH